ICYGLHLMAHLLGGKVEPSSAREYGPAELTVTEAVGVLGGFSPGETARVWMSHGDKLAALPPGFRPFATSANAPLCAFGDPARRLYALQFHPEVAHTPRGGEMLRSFLFQVAGLSPSWTPASFSDEAIERVRKRVGPSDRAICGLSGGVDSSVAAVLC